MLVSSFNLLVCTAPCACLLMENNSLHESQAWLIDKTTCKNGC